MTDVSTSSSLSVNAVGQSDMSYNSDGVQYAQFLLVVVVVAWRG